MRKKVKFLTYLLFGFTISAKGNEPVILGSPPPGITTNQDSKEKTPPTLFQKKVWIENMQKELPPLLCKKEHYFIQCYKINPKECDEFVQVLVRACLNSVSLGLPPELSVEEGKHWGQVVGRCTYDLYGKLMQKKKKDRKECNLPQPSSDEGHPNSSISPKATQ